jgi:predicted DNA-binding transcriptional regulator AlpA
MLIADGPLLGKRVLMKLLRVPEVSALTGVPEATLRFWRHMGTGPQSAKLGRRVVYRESDVNAWVDAQFETDSGAA